MYSGRKTAVPPEFTDKKSVSKDIDGGKTTYMSQVRGIKRQYPLTLTQETRCGLLFIHPTPHKPIRLNRTYLIPPTEALCNAAA